MKIEVDNKTVGIVVGAVTIAFSILFFLNSIHLGINDDTALRSRILMSESTRYAEIVKYYNDLEDDGKVLSLAQLKRKRLAEEQQCRIELTLKKNMSESELSRFKEELKSDCE